MESANMELVRSIFAAWERGDYTSIDWAHPEIEYTIADGPAPGVWIGKEALHAGGWRDFLSAWEDFRVAPEEFRELDEERVLALVTYSGRGRTSGLEVGRTLQSRGAGVFQIQDGKVRRQISYLNRERALTDLGLAPDAGSR